MKLVKFLIAKSLKL